MKDRFSSRKRKGQSAIEYLMTYGWMLLVVAIVGGAIFATVQGQQGSCDTSIPMSLDANQQGFGVSQFGPDAGNTQLVLKNNEDSQVTVNEVNITVQETGAENTLTGGSTSLGVGESDSWSTGAFSSADSCNTVTVEINYSVGQLTGQTMSGDMEAKLS